MPSKNEEVLCTYHYDPLDSLIGLNSAKPDALQRFYCKSRLATEIQGLARCSIVQQGDQLLAQQKRLGDAQETALLATDQQRSVMQTVGGHSLPIVYSPYGHFRAESGLTSLLGFNGERPDATTGHYLLGNGHRAFLPVFMRFNSPDRLSPFDKGGLNAYCYCSGDPVNRSDQTGRFSTWVSDLPGLFALKQFKDVVIKKKPWFMLDTMEIDVIKDSYRTSDPFRTIHNVPASWRRAKFNPRAHGRVVGQQKNWTKPRSLGQLSNDSIGGKIYVDAPQNLKKYMDKNYYRNELMAGYLDARKRKVSSDIVEVNPSSTLQRNENFMSLALAPDLSRSIRSFDFMKRDLKQTAEKVRNGLLT